MSIRAIPAPLWFVAALVPLVMSQIVRLEQSDPATWILWDYAGRVGALAVLGAIRSARTVAFQWERLRMTVWFFDKDYSPDGSSPAARIDRGKGPPPSQRSVRLDGRFDFRVERTRPKLQRSSLAGLGGTCGRVMDFSTRRVGFIFACSEDGPATAQALRRPL